MATDWTGWPNLNHPDPARARGERLGASNGFRSPKSRVHWFRVIGRRRLTVGPIANPSYNHSVLGLFPPAGRPKKEKPRSCPKPRVSPTIPRRSSRASGSTNPRSTRSTKRCRRARAPELINGVVRMPSPVGPAHGRVHFPMIVWLQLFCSNTPRGVEGRTIRQRRSGRKSEPQPDVMLRSRAASGRPNAADRRDSSIGIPELLVEVAETPDTPTLGRSWTDYERAGVVEYIVVWRSNPTRYSRLCLGTAASWISPQVRRRDFPLGSVSRLVARPEWAFKRTTRDGCGPYSTWGAPRPNTPNWSLAWPRRG